MHKRFSRACKPAMKNETPYRLHSVSVVVTAEFHNPSVLNRDFLVSKGIVPEDWEVAEALSTPAVSVLSYGNGIQWIVDQSKLTVTENCEFSFQEEYRVHPMVTRYLAALPSVPYRSLGLNFVVSMRRNNPGAWLRQRFLKPGNWQKGDPRIVGLVPNFALDAGDAVCNISFSAGQAGSSEGGPVDAVIVNGNMHHTGPLDAGGLREAIERWPGRQTFMITALNKLMKKPQR